MQALWALVFVVLTVAVCAWGWRRTHAALLLRGWRPFLSHCVGAISGAFFAALALLALPMMAAPGIGLVARLVFLLAVALILLGFWRMTAGNRKGHAMTTATAEVVGAVAARPVSEVAAPPSHPAADQIGTNFAFTYRKPDGTESRRTVRVERHGFDGASKYVEGHCSDAGASRSFRLDRVQGSVTVMETGELISASQMYRRLGDPSPTLEASSFAAAAKPVGRARRTGWQTAVFFAGFGANQYGELAELAEAADMDVRFRISRTVDYVVVGNLAGRQQLAQAEAHGIAVIDEHTFRSMV